MLMSACEDTGSNELRRQRARPESSEEKSENRTNQENGLLLPCLPVRAPAVRNCAGEGTGSTELRRSNAPAVRNCDGEGTGSTELRRAGPRRVQKKRGEAAYAFQTMGRY